MLYSFVRLWHQELRCHLSMNSKVWGAFQSIVLLITCVEGVEGIKLTKSVITVLDSYCSLKDLILNASLECDPTSSVLQS